MKPKLKALLTLTLAIAAPAVFAAGGGEADSDYVVLLPVDRVTVGVSMNYSYVGAGNVSLPHVSGNSDAQSIDANITAEFPLNDQWFAPIGLNSRNLLLGAVAGAPIPEQIDTLGFNAGLGYRLNSQWIFIASAGPKFYKVDGLDGDDIGGHGMFSAIWRVEPGLTAIFGLGVEPDNEVPALPIAGVRWDIRTNLTLNLMWPRPALIYHVNRQFDVFVAAGGEFAVFRADSGLGSQIGHPGFNNALGTYRDFELGAGAQYRIARGWKVGLDAGYSLGREIDYKRLNRTVSFGDSPYVRVESSYRF
ncbi:MAG TPA: DUF6268 family outer membrane beta-barrel protein [Verrucomicrobiae bacterium]|nr:DUF6268 family outer membrane beta-barrel protein [Verrucomicrobiae bacterium]